MAERIVAGRFRKSCSQHISESDPQAPACSGVAETLPKCCRNVAQQVSRLCSGSRDSAARGSGWGRLCGGSRRNARRCRVAAAHAAPAAAQDLGWVARGEPVPCHQCLVFGRVAGVAAGAGASTSWIGAIWDDIGRAGGRPVGRVGRAAGQSAGPSGHRSVGLAVGWSVGRPAKRAATRWAVGSVDKSAGRPSGRADGRSIGRSSRESDRAVATATAPAVNRAGVAQTLDAEVLASPS